MEIITPKEQIRKFFFEKHLDFLTSIPQQRLQEMILSSCMKGNSGKCRIMPKLARFTARAMAIFCQKESGMTKSWKKRKNAKAFRHF